MKKEELINIAENSLLSITTRPDVVMERGEGMYLWDTDGKKYLDFIGGWAVCSLGHTPKVVSDVLIEQSQKLINSSPSFYNKPMLEFTKLLIDNSAFDRVWFGNSGAEVNEAAVKLARKYGALKKDGAYEILTTKNSFHGRTLAMMSATGKDHWKELFNPKPSGFTHIPFNDLEAVKKAINKNTAAIMIEPIQGEGGVNPGTQEYIKGLRDICNEHGILLIFDEVQTGFGRTGEMFSYEKYGIEPDIMTLAKGIGSGFPLSALMVKEQYNIFEPGEQGGTYGGQQLAMVVGSAVTKEVLKKEFLENVDSMGKYIKDRLKNISEELGLSEIRGMGLLIGFNLDETIGSEVVNRCMENGLIINSPRPNMLRLMPPLIVNKDEVDEMMKILLRSIKEVKKA